MCFIAAFTVNAPEPEIRIFNVTDDGIQLRCLAQGVFPKPVLKWKDSSGNILPAEEPQVTDRGGSYDVSLQTTVKKTNNYTCVSTQEEIKHQVYTRTYVYVNGKVLFKSSIHYLNCLLSVTGPTYRDKHIMI